MNSPLISVIIPAYNLEPYIARCLDSVLAQSYTNLEIIIVNDGSKDRTGMILEEYKKKDNRIRVIHKKNTGVSDTRNKGIDIATGDYIGFVDGDDVIHPDMYKILLENAMKYDADISHCGYQMVFPNRKDDYYGTGRIVIQDNKKGVFDLLKADYVEPGLWNKLFKKEILKNIRLNREIRINEDLLFNYYAFKKSNKSVFEDQMMYYYMVRSSSASTQKLNKNKILDPIKVLLEIEKMESGENLELVHKRMLYWAEKFFSFKRTIFQYISKDEYDSNKKLIRRLFAHTKNNRCVTKIDLYKAKLAFYTPWVYRMIYRLYDMKVKSSKKYEV